METGVIADRDLYRRLGELIAEVRQLRSEVATLDRKVEALELSGAKWGGVLLAVAGAATVIGWMTQAFIRKFVGT